MASETLLDLLTKLSANRLRQMREAIESEIARLQFEVEYVERALSEKEGKRAASGPGVGAASSVKGRRGSKREPIKQIMATEPDRVWMPAEVRQRLDDMGIEITSAAVRVTLRRMLDDDLLERGEEGHGFKLAATNGSLLDPSQRPQSEVGG